MYYITKLIVEYYIMTLKIKDLFGKGYERVIHATNETTLLDCIIAIHNTKLGPALGGVRSWDYRNFDDLAKGFTFKTIEIFQRKFNHMLLLMLQIYLKLLHFQL